tara:strand:+ start:372 stop:887 length:516 start_codon:yes stop_codon:yes gene_type:complete
MTESFKNIVRLPPPHTARSYSELTPVYTADEVAKTIASFEAELEKANEIISECWRLVGNDVDSKSALPESVNSLNERVNELEEENDLMMTRLMAAALGLASGKSCPTAIEELNKFALEKKIEAIKLALDGERFELDGRPLDFGIRVESLELMLRDFEIGLNSMPIRKGGES